MLPIGDDNRQRQRLPIVTGLLVAANVLMFLYELRLQHQSPLLLQQFIDRWGLLPRELATMRDLPPFHGGPVFITIFTSMFLHAGWGHLLGNMLYLWVFGDNVEDRFGRVAFILFYLGTGMLGALAQVVVDPGSMVPTIGASGAISGILGAYVLMFPLNRVRVLVFFFIVEVPAFVIIGLWALTQFVSGAGVIVGGEAHGVAYVAHVGGFASGLVGAWILKRVVRRRPPPPSEGPRLHRY